MNSTQAYETLTFKLIQLLSYKVLKTDDGRETDDSSRYEHYVWVKKFVKLQSALQFTEQNIGPTCQFSNAAQSLSIFLK